MKYRILRKGERIKKGDEYLSGEEWWKTSNYPGCFSKKGQVVGDRHSMTIYRRKIKQKKVI